MYLHSLQAELQEMLQVWFSLCSRHSELSAKKKRKNYKPPPLQQPYLASHIKWFSVCANRTTFPMILQLLVILWVGLWGEYVTNCTQVIALHWAERLALLITFNALCSPFIPFIFPVTWANRRCRGRRAFTVPTTLQRLTILHCCIVNCVFFCFF